MLEIIKAAGVVTASLLALALLFIIGGIVFNGFIWLTQTIEPLLMTLVKWSVITQFSLLLPFSFFRFTRPIVGGLCILASIIHWSAVCVKSVVVLLGTWGPPGVLLGGMLGGVGIFPASIVAGAMNGRWTDVAAVLLLLVFAIATHAHIEWADKQT